MACLSILNIDVFIFVFYSRTSSSSVSTTPQHQQLLSDLRTATAIAVNSTSSSCNNNSSGNKQHMTASAASGVNTAIERRPAMQPPHQQHQVVPVGAPVSSGGVAVPSCCEAHNTNAALAKQHLHHRGERHSCMSVR